MAESATATRIFADLARALPEGFVDLLQQALAAKSGDRVAELGCGSGELAARLASHGIHVDATDSSATMIASAKANYPGHLVHWFRMTADAFLDESDSKYAGFYAMEAFHLFRDPTKLIARIADYLLPGGSLAIAWRIAEWESRCGMTVPAVFARYGAAFPNWSYSMCHGLPEWLGPGWHEPETSVFLAPSRSSVPEVVDYLCAIDLATHIRERYLPDFRRDIAAAVAEVATDEGMFAGQTQFGVTVARRHVGDWREA